MKSKSNTTRINTYWQTALRGLFLGIISVFFYASAQAQTLPFHDPFNYANNLALGSGASTPPWIAGNGVGQGSATNLTVANLTYSGLAASSGNGIRATVSSSRNRGINFTTQTLGTGNPTVYASFLLQVQGAPSANKCLAYLRQGTGSGTPTLGVFLNPSSQLMICKNASSPAVPVTSALTVGQTYLVVVRLKWATGSNNDEAALWLDPTGLGNDENSVPAFSISTTTGGSDPTTLDSFFVAGLISDASLQYMDEVRVGLTWADVTPTGVCTPAGVSATTNATANVGSTVDFFVTATGSSPTYQWQVSTDNGTSFNNVGDGSGANTAHYTTHVLSGADNNTQYRAIVSVACDSSSATSAPPAVLSVVDLTGYSFRSSGGGSGNWNDPGTWQQSSNGINWDAAVSAPSSANSNITVRAGHTVTVIAPVTIDDTVVEATGQITCNGGALTVVDGPNHANDLDVAGTLEIASNNPLVNSGGVVRFTGTYRWNSTAAGNVPLATWDTDSTCEIANGASGTAPSNLNQSFYNFFWNWPGSGSCNLAGQLTDVRNDLRINGSATAASSVRFLATSITCNLVVGRDVILEGGNTTISGGSTASTILNLYVGRNFVINSGAFFDSRNSGSGSAGNVLFTNTAVSHSFTNAGGITHSGTGGGCPINWVVDAGVTLNLGSGNLDMATANNATRDSITVNGTLNCNGSTISGPGDLTLAGTLGGNGASQIGFTLNTVNCGGTLVLSGLPPYVGGEEIQLFTATSYTGGPAPFTINPSIPGLGLSWDQSTVTTDGKLKVSTGVGPVIHQPRVNSIQRSGADLIFSGTNGTASGAYNILTTPTPSTPLSNWDLLMSGNFQPDGTFSWTNTISGPRLFYVIQQVIP